MLPHVRLRFIITGLPIGLLAVSLTFAQTNPFPSEPFTDVPGNHPHYQAIEYLRQQKVLRGYLDGTFKPSNRITRAEFVKLITNPALLDTVRLHECISEHVPSDSTFVFFPDVRRDAWYASEVCHAKIKDLINGYPDGTFRPGKQMNIAETAKILSNVFRLNVAQEPKRAWYEPYVMELANRKAIPLTVHSLSETLTRGQMAEMLYRLHAGQTGKPSQTYAALKP